MRILVRIDLNHAGICVIDILFVFNRSLIVKRFVNSIHIVQLGRKSSNL